METKFEKGFALIIGVGNDLKGTVTDAEAIAKILKDETKAGYPEDQVILLTEKEASHDRILQALDELKQKVENSGYGANATVLVYFSGHGVRYQVDGNFEYFFVPNDYKFDEEQPLVSGKDFMSKIDAIPSKRNLILIDSCYAGGFKMPKVIRPRRKVEAATGEIAQALGKGAGKIIIASSTEKQKSLAGSEDNLSLFTEALVEILSGEGMEDAPFITVMDVMQHIAKAVPEKASAKNYTQTPLFNVVDSTPWHLCKNTIEQVPAVPKIFTIYDPADRKYYEGFNKFLKTLADRGLFEKWSADDIIPGDSIRQSLQKNLEEAQIVIPLVSSNYLANDDLIKLQKEAIRRNKDFMPILVNHCLYEFDEDLADLALEPRKNEETDPVPVSDWDNMDEAFTSILRKIIKKAKKK